MYGSLREYIDLLEREGELVRIKACVNPVEEMAEISPMCSIIAAMAIGAMTRMAETSNLAMTNCCRPIRFALLTEAKLTSGCITPFASGSCAPQAVAMSATR